MEWVKIDSDKGKELYNQREQITEEKAKEVRNTLIKSGQPEELKLICLKIERYIMPTNGFSIEGKYTSRLFINDGIYLIAHDKIKRVECAPYPSAYVEFYILKEDTNESD